MFDFAWSELALIAVVALVAIGPKDMPVAIRTLKDFVRKARRMASEFQTHVDEMVRDADLGALKASISEIRNFDIKGEIEKTVDADGSLRTTFASNPLEPTTTPVPEATSIEELAVSEPVVEPEPSPAPQSCEPQAPAFVPPNLVRAAATGGAAAEAPAFIPPEVVRQRHG